MNRVIRLAAMAIVAAGTVALAGASPAAAHPLGNFSVNHYDGLRFERDRIVVEAVVDTAEIPTAQIKNDVDSDGNGQASDVELAAYGASRCGVIVAALDLTVDGTAGNFAIVRTSFVYQTGQAALPTSRVDCSLEAKADFTEPHRVVFSDGFESSRVGWREITAIGAGARLASTTVPVESISKGLTTYPVDLLTSPLNVRTASFDVVPGSGTAANANDTSKIAATRPFSSPIDRFSRRFNDLVGRRQLTIGVGLLAVALSLLLGASHAVLPGHGKTVMAAYIAGRQGSVRDALVVGATVTVTHTGGVLLLGLALTLSASLAGESVLAWLGVVSGLLVAALGLGLLISAARRRPSHRHTGHSHDHADGHSHGGHHHSHSNVALIERTDDEHVVAFSHVSRRGLVGMGIAGGLVPSPSALVVLLSAIALGRTSFGVALVVAYGFGMAATLTLAGVLLVKVRNRIERGAADRSGRLTTWVRRWSNLAPYATATLVLVVGLVLAARSLSTV